MANFFEDRSHFGAWVITSSPLIMVRACVYGTQYAVCVDHESGFLPPLPVSFFSLSFSSQTKQQGYDMNDESLTDKVWPILTNKEAIAINQVRNGRATPPLSAHTLPPVCISKNHSPQAWEGHPGRLVKTWKPTAPTPAPGPGSQTAYVEAIACDGTDAQKGWAIDVSSKTVKGPGGLCLDWTPLETTRWPPTPNISAPKPSPCR